MLLTGKNIEKTYTVDHIQKLDVLKGIDISIDQGEILAIIGHSGAGKSTLLHILGALDKPTKGQVLIGDRDISKMSETELSNFRNKHVGFVYQFHHLLPEFTALENVALPFLIQRGDKASALKRAGQLLEEVGLQERTEHRPRELSGGEQQRVAFARAMMNDPMMILADEPSGNLDLKNSKALHQLMWDLVKKRNKTFVVVTHNRELAARADRVIELHDGQVLKS
jgi:lipoprotein-releasing system ATP-binding protein